MAASARQQIDIGPDLREIGTYGAAGIGYGTGVGQMGNGVLELNGRRFCGGLLMLVLTLCLHAGVLTLARWNSSELVEIPLKPSD